MVTMFGHAENCVHRYRIAGLAVSSDVEMPGLYADASFADPPDVAIRSGPAPERLDAAAAAGPTWAIAADRFLLRVPGVARFLLTGGHAIDYHAEPTAQPGDVAAFLIGTVFGILLHQRGLVVLHASGVELNGRAALFLGASGAGKSTLAAALAQRGYRLVTDDFCVVKLGAEGGPTVSPDGRLPKLWAQAITQLGLGDRQGRPVRGRVAKFYVEPGARQAQAKSLPVGPVYVLREARGPHWPGIERPNVVDAALLLRQNAYRPRLIDQMGRGALYFRTAAAIAGGGGVFFLTRQMEFAAMSATIDRLERHWDQTEAREGAA
ncbi:MAG TPA: hypothetical protein VKQ70_07365 [Caulobacteraceae bacterium]|jgi:hypothetical protein|nr:hypothetical protein [Caulobacteraceae bacterium]